MAVSMASSSSGTAPDASSSRSADTPPPSRSRWRETSPASSAPVRTALTLFDRDEVRLLEEMAGKLAFGLVERRRREERARSAAALAESEERYRQMFDRGKVAKLLIDPNDGAIVDANAAAAAFYG